MSRPPPAIVANEVLDAVSLAETSSGRVIGLNWETSVLTEPWPAPNRTSANGVKPRVIVKAVARPDQKVALALISDGKRLYPRRKITVAISNHRLRALENGRVSFEWKDYAQHGQRKIMTLDAVEFMRRFLLHVLPPGLVRIRQFGFLANRFRTRNLQLGRDLLAVCQPPAPADSHNPADTDVPDRSSCPICRLGRLIRIEVIHPERAMVPDTS
jgi:hypothetical protein